MDAAARTLGALSSTKCKMSWPTVHARLHRTALIVACLATVIALPGMGQNQQSGPYRIPAVRAFLYLNQKDSVSANIIDNPSVGDLLNIHMGGGWVGSPSQEVVITVEVVGERGGYASGRRIHLTVRKADGSVLVDRRPQIGLLGDDGKWFETFVVYDSFCDTLRIRAEILGQKEPSVVEKHIDFR